MGRRCPIYRYQKAEDAKYETKGLRAVGSIHPSTRLRIDVITYECQRGDKLYGIRNRCLTVSMVYQKAERINFPFDFR